VSVQQTVSPIDGRVLVERPLATPAALDRALTLAQRAWRDWRREPLEARMAAVARMLDHIEAHAPALAEELTWQMGRPLRASPGEIAGFLDRGRTMLRLAPEALAPIELPPKPGFTRSITRESLGVVLVLSPWNYPWLCTVNVLVPALIAGNTVLLKHSDQTPLVAERLTEAARAAGLPEGVLTHLHMGHDLVADAVRDSRVAHVAFTGSVPGGRAVHAAAGGTFKTVGLELGGKDAAYIRPDADLDFTVENVVDGAFFNSGQSCCAVERVFVHHDVFDEVADRVASLVRTYVLDDPTLPATTLGPVVRVRNAEAITAAVSAALADGARPLVAPHHFPAATERGLPYLAPTVLIDVSASMAIMREETFGPVIGLMPVAGDDAAIRLINDSPYGLTASVWSADADAAARIGAELDVGTVFLNRADALDPELAWVGVKDSGRGVTLSRLGYEPLTRPKSYHFRLRES
jgi:acyl-CoA reductase-like NAD-dependent aldehyde dehydrogenase